jgi:hypothetical protein
LQHCTVTAELVAADTIKALSMFAGVGQTSLKEHHLVPCWCWSCIKKENLLAWSLVVGGVQSWVSACASDPNEVTKALPDLIPKGWSVCLI